MSLTNTSTAVNRVSTSKTSYSFETALKSLSNLNGKNVRTHTFPHILASPIHYEPNYAYPLLVWLHGTGKSEVELFDVLPKISTQNYVAVAPRGALSKTTRVVRRHINGSLVDEKIWTEKITDWAETERSISESENLVFQSIEEATRKFNINPRRIFLLGRGAGATMALQIGLRNADEFAGIVAIDGSFPSEETVLFRNWRSIRDLPILMTTPNVSGKSYKHISSNQLRLMHTAGMTFVVRQYNEYNVANSEQNRMDRILNDCNRWIMSRSCNPRSPISNLTSMR